MQIEQLHGTVERITYYNEQNGFAVLRVAVPRSNELLTVVGTIPQLSVGEDIDCSGYWFNDSNYGLQFKAQHIQVTLPSSRIGIERYLGSGLIKGIGPKFAKKLVDALGIEILEIIDQQPERLKSVPGIGQQRYQQILQSWEQQKAVRAIMLFLHAHGLGSSKAMRIHKTYGHRAIAIITENPYRLALDIHGIGFHTADALAQKLNIAPNSLHRATAGLRHVMQEQASEGHCAVAQPQLVDLTEKLLAIEQPIILEALQAELARGGLVQELFAGDAIPYIFLSIFYKQEREIALHLKRLTSYPSSTQYTAADIQAQQSKSKLKLSLEQQEAVLLALTHKISIITGGPGVGKTTVINCILQVLAYKAAYIALAAPTGRAAKRMSECCRREAKTLHRLLDFDPSTKKFRRDAENPIAADYIIIDETSMLDLSMLHALLNAVGNTSCLIFIGDVDQLPSVGPGAVLRDLINAEVLATARLNKIFRQAASSKIILNAHRINQGYLPEVASEQQQSDWYYLSVNSAEEAMQKILVMVKERIPQKFKVDALKDIQVLTPMNRGKLGAAVLNNLLQSQLNPHSQQTHKVVTKFGTQFALGDKVMQIVNNYDREVFNGDIGYIVHFDLESSELTVQFDTRNIAYTFDELDELVLAYAITVHKSQGSEFPVVVLPITYHHYALLQRNLLYTGITRGKRLVILLGDKRAIAVAVKQAGANERVTHLKTRLQLLFQ
jgi:exodeoxyribonuclease V alpha subunit